MRLIGTKSVNASNKNCVLFFFCRACLRVKVPVVFGAYETGQLATLVAATVVSEITEKPCQDNGLC